MNVGAADGQGDVVLDILELSGPIPYRLLEALVGSAAIERHERAGTLRPGPSVTDLVRPTSPSAGVGSSASPASHEINLLRSIATAIERDGLDPVPPDVAARLGGVMMRADTYVDDVVVRATRAALISADAQLALDLTAFGLSHDESQLDLIHLRSMALEGLGHHGAATAVDVAHAGLSDPAWLGRWASNIWLTTGRNPHQAVADSVDDHDNEMLANQAWVEAFQGDVAVVASTVSTILDDPHSSAQAIVWACGAGAFPAALDGRPVVAMALIDHAKELVAEHRDSLTPFAELQVGLVEMMTLLRLGHLTAATELAEHNLTLADSPMMLAIWSLFSGIVAREQGRFSTGLERFDAGLSAFDGDPFGLVPWALSERQVCAAMASPQEPVDEPTIEGHLLFQSSLHRNVGWVRAACGDVDGAITAIDAAITTARSLGQNVHHILALVDLARFGEPRRAASMLTELSEVSASTMVSGAAIITALAEPDHERLVQASRHVAESTADLVADELLCLAREQALSRGEPEFAARVDLIETGRRLPTPILTASEDVARILTARERSIALRAATGHTSHEISRQLEVSRRTVDNLLGRVYAKCRFAGRGELADWCTPHLDRQSIEER